MYAACYADLAYSLKDSNGNYDINLTAWNVSGTKITFGNYLEGLLQNDLIVASLDSYNGSINWINNYYGFTNVSESATVFGTTENYSYVKGQLSPIVYGGYLALFGWSKILKATSEAFGPLTNSINPIRSNYTRLMLINKTTGTLSCAVNYSNNDFGASDGAAYPDSKYYFALVNSNLFADSSNDSIQVQGLSSLRFDGLHPWFRSTRNWGINLTCNQRFPSTNLRGSKPYDLNTSTPIAVNNSIPLNTSIAYLDDGMDSGGIMDYSRNLTYFFNNDCRAVAYYPVNQSKLWSATTSVMISVYNSTNASRSFFNLTSCGQFVSEPVLWNNTLLIGTSFSRLSQENKTLYDGNLLDLNTTKVVAVNVSSKKLQWIYPNYTFTNATGYNFSNYGSVNSRSSPIVYKDSLVIIKVENYYNSSGVAVRNNSIVALNLTDGTEVWNFDLNSNDELVDYTWDSNNVNRPLGVIIGDKLYLRELDYGDSSLSSSNIKKRPVIILWANNGTRASNYVLPTTAPISLWNSLISASNFLYYPTDVVASNSNYYSYTRKVTGANYTSVQSLADNTTFQGGQDGSDISFITATTTDNSKSQPSLVKVGVNVNESLTYNYSFFVTDSWYSTNYTSCNLIIDNGTTKLVEPVRKYDNYVESPVFQTDNIKIPSLPRFYTFTVNCSNYLNWNTTRSQNIYAYPQDLG
ncbi:Uncharacterised protein [uncultured archaeon]|nr:Uncharacterised protein [uncultured archaeon]